MKKFLLLMIGIFLLSFNIVVSADVSDCGVLKERETTYVLKNDLKSTWSTCLIIQSWDITLDCQGHNITGARKSDSYGISIADYSYNVTIKNCNISGFDVGIYNNNNAVITIEGNRLESNGIGFRSWGGSSGRITIEGNRLESNDVGISFTYGYNNRISNNIISSSIGDGIHIDSTTSVKITDNIISSSGNNGIFIHGAWDYQDADMITGNTINSNTGSGIYMEGADGSTIKGNHLESNGMGIYLGYYIDSYYGWVIGSKKNDIIENVISSSKDSGIYIRSSSNNIYNNLFNNSKNAEVDGSNYWNTTKQFGGRIYGARAYEPGKYIGGNYWTNPTGNGHSDTCTEKDCFCEEPYVIDENNIDYLPLNPCWRLCQDKYCYTDKEGSQFAFSDRGPGPYEDYGGCRYFKMEKCRTDAEKSDADLILPFLEQRNLKVKGYCIDYTGCANGECTQDPLKNDYCTELLPDINKDGKINILDIAIVAKAFGTKPENTNWNPVADIDGNEKVDIIDIAKVARDYGKIVIEEPGLLIEYYNTDGSCDTQEINCSQTFKQGRLNGAEWSCKNGACIGCQNNEDCYAFINNDGYRTEDGSPLQQGEECIITHCKDKCVAAGYVREWYCDTDQYCKYRDLTDECDVNVQPNKVCKDGEQVSEVDASYEYNCAGQNVRVPFCSANSCSGEWHYPACDGHGNCDENAEKYFEVEQINASEGKVYNTNCESVPGSCRSEWKCNDDCSKNEVFYACNGRTNECDSFLRKNDPISCNPYTCSDGSCTKQCSSKCNARCVPPASQSCGRCNSGTQACGSDCKWGFCEGESGCSPGSTQKCGNCNLGTQTCSQTCQWGSCVEGGCKPGDTGGSCSGGYCCPGTLKCGSDCQWDCDAHPDSSLCDIGCRSDCTCETG